MDAVLEQISNQEKQRKPHMTKLQLAYKIYHFAAKIFLYSILMILILVAIAFILYFVDEQINAKKGIDKQPLFGAYIIISPSMVPTINVYDAIVIKRAEPEDLEVDDVITFLSTDPRYSGLVITHRIVGIEKSKTGEIYFRTKGDNNNTEDSSLVRASNIYGKVMLKIPKIGYIQQVLTTAVGWVVLIVIPCLGVVIYDIIKMFKAINPKKLSSKNDKNYNQNLDSEDNDNIEIISDSKNIIKKEKQEESVEDVLRDKINAFKEKNSSINNKESEDDIEIL